MSESNLIEKENVFLIGTNKENRNIVYGTSIYYLKNSGCTEFDEIKTKIIKTFDSLESVKEEVKEMKVIKNLGKEKREELNNYFYGFWNKNENKFNLLYPSLIQTQICFADFGKSIFNEGSLFVKFKIEK